MARFRYAAGLRVILQGQRYRFICKSDAGEWNILNENTNAVSSKSLAELNLLYLDGELALNPDQIESVPGVKLRPRLKGSVSIPISDMPKAARDRIQLRRTVLDQIDQRVPRGMRHSKLRVDNEEITVLEKHLRDISREIGRRKPVSVATFYRWEKIKGESEGLLALQGRARASGNRRQLSPRLRQIIKQVIAGELQSVEDRKNIGGKPTFSMHDIALTVAARIEAERQLAPALDWKVPSKTTLYRILAEFPAYQVSVARHGRQKARKDYRAVYGHLPEEMCLDLVEYDETELDIYLFDEDIGVPLGRPILTWYLDVYSHMPIGFYVGFERPSDLTLSSALRHACLPKEYVAREYPHIKNRYLGMGIPRLITFDNSLTAHGKTAESITLNLETHYRWAPPRTPWFKPVVENMFKVLNQKLLSRMPGFVLGRQIDPKDYNPQKNGCVGFRKFVMTFHEWLIDTYSNTVISNLKETPAQRWERGTRECGPDMLSSRDDLDAIFGVVRPATYDHRGIRFHNVFYYDECLHALRMHKGPKGEIKIKIDPANIGAIRVLDAQSEAWIKVKANHEFRDYADGMSLHRHILNRKQVHLDKSPMTAENLRKAEWRLKEHIADSLAMALGPQINFKIARAAGIGTQSFFNGLSADGRIPALTGAFEGKSLDPARDNDSPRASDYQRKTEMDEVHIGRPKRSIPKLSVNLTTLKGQR